MLASIALNVAASRPSSSWCCGVGMRCERSREWVIVPAVSVMCGDRPQRTAGDRPAAQERRRQARHAQPEQQGAVGCDRGVQAPQRCQRLKIADDGAALLDRQHVDAPALLRRDQHAEGAVGRSVGRDQRWRQPRDGIVGWGGRCGKDGPRVKRR